MNLDEFKNDVSGEVSTILAADFKIDVTNTQTVPHSSDGAITFPNLDQKYQGTKLIETTVLYVDMRRSTLLSLQHQQQTVARLYSAFVRAIARCARQFGGEVRGIIGDRVMVLFSSENCYTAAVDTAVLINSVCKYIINKHFVQNEVAFGIGIDHGRMLATKTGVRRHGAAQQSYRSLVWLGRPANVASKLTDNANKPEEWTDLTKVYVAYQRNGTLVWENEYPHEFVQKFTLDVARNLMLHSDPAFHSFRSATERVVTRKATPPILMTRRVYSGFRQMRPSDPMLANGWLAPAAIKIVEHKDQIYGCNTIYTTFLR